MSKENKYLWLHKLLYRIAFITSIFVVLICILMLANFLQLKKSDPVNQKIINTLVERLYQNPDDHELRAQVRELDLLARKAYFTNQWQIKTGTYLALAGIAIIIIVFQWIIINTKKIPESLLPEAQPLYMNNKNARKWIAIGGSMILLLALVSAWLTSLQLKDKFNEKLVQNKQATASDSVLQVSDNIDSNIADSSTIAISANPTEIKDSSNVPTETIIEEDGSKDNFPIFRGSMGHGIVKQKGIPLSWDAASGKNILWKITVPLPGYNSPVLWGRNLFITGADANKREVYCYDKNDGKQLWKVEVKNIEGSPAVAPKVLAETGHAAPTAATDGNGVYAVFSNGDIVGIDMNGKLLWAFNLGIPNNHYGHSSSLLLVNGKVIVQYDQRNAAKLIALNSKTGKQIWSVNRQVKASWASPILIKWERKTMIIAAAEPYVAAYDPETGNEIWKNNCIGGEVGPSPAYANGTLFTVNDYSKFAAIKLSDPTNTIWTNDEYLSDIPSPVANEKYAIVVTSFGVMAVYDAVSGSKIFEKELNESVYSSPMIVNDKLFVTDKNGLTRIFKMEENFPEIGQNKVDDTVFPTLAFAEGKIFIRGHKYLYCIGKK